MERGCFPVMAKFEVRLMFDWGGACLWGMNAAAKEKYGYAEIERVLPITPEISDKLAKLSKWHDEALNWANPAGPSPWTKNDFTNFESAALSLLQVLQDELGDQFHVWYDPLGEA